MRTWCLLSFILGCVCVHGCDLYSCMCVHVHVCICVSLWAHHGTHVEVRGQPVRSSLTFYLKRRSLVVRLSSLSCHKSDGATHACYCERLLHGFGGSEFRSSCLQERVFAGKPSYLCANLLLSLIVKLCGYQRIVLRWIHDSFSVTGLILHTYIHGVTYKFLKQKVVGKGMNLSPP